MILYFLALLSIVLACALFVLIVFTSLKTADRH
jgi:hypothetical protein